MRNGDFFVLVFVPGMLSYLFPFPGVSGSLWASKSVSDRDLQATNLARVTRLGSAQVPRWPPDSKKDAFGVTLG